MAAAAVVVVVVMVVVKVVVTAAAVVAGRHWGDDPRLLRCCRFATHNVSFNFND